MRKTVVIAGASRGIGLGLTKAWLQRGARVYALARSASPDLGWLQQGWPDHLEVVHADITAADTGKRLHEMLDGESIDYLILNAGVYGPAHQDILKATAAEIQHLIETNAVAPLRLARQLAPLLPASGVIAFMSSQMASIELGLAADMPLYGASKAMLNSLIRSWSQATDAPAAPLLALHPGWVQTDMGGSEAPVSIETSVAGLIATMEAHSGQPGCHFCSFEQQPLPW